MNRFQATLKRIDQQLHLPPPTRSRILLEMAGDLEDLFEHHRAAGLDEAEAARRAEEAVAVDEDALERLLAVHRSALDRVGERVAGHLAGGWEKALFGVLLAFAVLVAGQALLASGGLLAHTSAFVWPILALGAVALGIVLSKLYALIGRRPVDVRRLRSGLGGLLAVVVGSLVIGVNGFLIELFFFLRGYAAGQLDRVWPVAVASMMIVTTVTAILAALAWFVLTRWVTRIENREAEQLLTAA